MSIEEGCKTAVETCMGVGPNDRVVIVSDESSMSIGRQLRKAALEVTPRVRFFNLDIYGKRPLSRLPDLVEKETRDATVTFWTAASIKGELETVRRPFMTAAITGGRHAHMVDISEKIMKTGMAADYNEVSRFTEALHDILMDTREIKVKNDLGTDFTAIFEEVKWVASKGISQEPGHWINLPSGEIFTAPTSMEGRIVVDGVLGEYFGHKYPHAVLKETPVTVDIAMKQRASAVNVECENSDLLNELQEYLSLHPCSSWVGEVGLGTNIFLKELIDNMLQDEKFPGVHVAFGDPIQTETYAGWSCPEHLDMVLTGCDVWFDGKKIMENSKYIIEI